MRSRVHVLAILASLALLAGAAHAADTSAPATEAAKAAPKAEAVKAAAPDAAIAAIDAQIKKAAVDKKNPAWRTKLPMPTVVKFDPAKTYLVRMATNKGDVVIKFRPDVAPMHVTSFIYLTRMGFYDGLNFHRVITNFMAQGGCPLGTGTGSPGYQFNGEYSPAVTHNRPGLLSMANAGPGTDGSQFFLTFVPTKWLDGKHTIFGEVVEGMDTLKALEAKGSQSGQTSERLFMTRLTVEVK